MAKNINDIRAIIFDEIEKLRENKTTAANVNAITNAVGKVIATVKLELEYAKITNKQPSNDFLQLQDKPVVPAD